ENYSRRSENKITKAVQIEKPNPVFTSLIQLGMTTTEWLHSFIIEKALKPSTKIFSLRIVTGDTLTFIVNDNSY
ncbi:MAG: hypothetical protein UV61_C0013G0017, partial [Candidatus Gottesmanbacteria bacterium GW2011_GWB1_43_11]